MHQGGVFPDRQARDLPPRNSQTGGRGRPQRRRPHLVPCQPEQQAAEEIEKGFSAVKLALGAAPSPFFRFPQLQHGPAAVAYLGSRNVAIFSCDLDSFDFKAKDATQIINSVLTKLEKSGKGIILMHDFQKHTAEALPVLLRRLKAGGYKVVQMKTKAPLQTLAEYDEALVKDMKLPVASTRPVNNVVQTVTE